MNQRPSTAVKRRHVLLLFISPHVTSGTSDVNPISSRDASSLIREPEATEASDFPVRGAFLLGGRPICNAGCINALRITILVREGQWWQHCIPWSTGTAVKTAAARSWPRPHRIVISPSARRRAQGLRTHFKTAAPPARAVAGQVTQFGRSLADRHDRLPPANAHRCAFESPVRRPRQSHCRSAGRIRPPQHRRR